MIEAGPADADEAIVFVHGNPGVAEDWLPLLEPAGAFARAVAIDMPGYGGADKPRDLPYTVPGYAAPPQPARWTSSASSASTWSCTTSAARGACSGRPTTRSCTPRRRSSTRA